MNKDIPIDLHDAFATVIHIKESLTHETFIFPDDISKTATFTAGANAFAWGSWKKIKDSNGIELDGDFDIQFTGLRIRNPSEDNILFQFELAWKNGTKYECFDRHVFRSGKKDKGIGDEQTRFLPNDIPAGKKVYYRMKSEVGGASFNISFRYHYHS